MTRTKYYVQALLDGGLPEILGHSKDEDTGEIYYKFLYKKDAMALLEAEKEISPEFKYRVVKESINYTNTEWI